MEISTQERFDTLMKLLSNQSDENALEYGDDLEDLSKQQRLRDLFVEQERLKDMITVKSRRLSIAAHNQFLGATVASKEKKAPAQPEPPKPRTLREGQRVGITCWDLENKRGKRVMFGWFIDHSKTNIVCVKLTSGKKVYLSNSSRYKWEVKAISGFPVFALPNVRVKA